MAPNTSASIEPTSKTVLLKGRGRSRRQQSPDSPYAVEVLGHKLDLSRATLAEIGRVTVCWSALEFTMQAIVWHLLRLERTEGLAVTTHLSMPRLTELALTLIDQTYGDGDKWKRADALFRRVGRMGTERNNIVHSIWFDGRILGPPDLSHALTHRARGKMRWIGQDYLPEHINDTALRVQKLDRELVTFLHELNRDAAERWRRERRLSPIRP